MFDRDASAHDRRSSGETQTRDGGGRPTVHDPSQTTLQLTRDSVTTDPPVLTSRRRHRRALLVSNKAAAACDE